MGKIKYSKLHNKSRDDVITTSSLRKMFCVRVFIGYKFDDDWRLFSDQNCARKRVQREWDDKINEKSIINQCHHDVMLLDTFLHKGPLLV